MPETPAELSKVTPVVVAVLVCDAGLTDPNSQKKTLQGIFDHLMSAAFPTQPRNVTVYLKISSADGRYKISVTLVDLQEATPIGSVMGDAEFSDRLAAPDFFVPFPPIQFQHPGRYEFQVAANDIYLGGTILTVLQTPQA